MGTTAASCAIKLWINLCNVPSGINDNWHDGNLSQAAPELVATGRGDAEDFEKAWFHKKQHVSQVLTAWLLSSLQS